MLFVLGNESTDTTTEESPLVLNFTSGAPAARDYSTYVSAEELQMLNLNPDEILQLNENVHNQIYNSSISENMFFDLDVDEDDDANENDYEDEFDIADEDFYYDEDDNDNNDENIGEPSPLIETLSNARNTNNAPSSNQRIFNNLDDDTTTTESLSSVDSSSFVLQAEPFLGNEDDTSVIDSDENNENDENDLPFIGGPSAFGNRLNTLEDCNSSTSTTFTSSTDSNTTSHTTTTESISYDSDQAFFFSQGILNDFDVINNIQVSSDSDSSSSL